MGTKDAIATLERNPNGIKFSQLAKILEERFGKPRQVGTSHRIYRTPWQGNPRLNIQNRRGMAKPYQVRQAIAALRKMAEQEMDVGPSGCEADRPKPPSGRGRKTRQGDTRRAATRRSPR